MSHINVTINGRQYRMACEEGQEVRLLKLAESLETRVGELRGKFGEIGDARLTVMAALTVCDELLGCQRAHPRAGGRTRNPAQRSRRRRRPRQGHPGRGRQRTQRRRRPHRKDHADAEPHHRQRRRDRVKGGVSSPSPGGSDGEAAGRRVAAGRGDSLSSSVVFQWERFCFYASHTLPHKSAPAPR